MVAVIIGTLYGAASGFIGGRVDSLMMRVLGSSTPSLHVLRDHAGDLLRPQPGAHLHRHRRGELARHGADRARPDSEPQEQGVHRGGSRLRRLKWKIITRHIVPNVLGIVAVYATLLVPGMIMFESFLSFLGLGVQSP